MPTLDEEKRAAQRAAARRRQASFRAREKARGLEMVTIKIPASMREAFTQLAASVRDEAPSEDVLEASFAGIRQVAGVRRSGAPLPPEPAPPESMELAGLWRPLAPVHGLAELAVAMAELDGTLYSRWTARPQGAPVDAYVRGTRDGDTLRVTAVHLGGRTLRFEGTLTAPDRIEGTLALDDAASPIVFTRPE